MAASGRLWPGLLTFSDSRAKAGDLDGVAHPFADCQSVQDWLHKDADGRLEEQRGTGEVDPKVTLPGDKKLGSAWDR